MPEPVHTVSVQLDAAQLRELVREQIDKRLRAFTKPLVYIAGPYAKPDPVQNTRKAIEVAEDIEVRFDVALLIPHLNMVWDLVSPAPPSRWYVHDLHLLERCDALVRLPGESTGADREVEYAVARRIPVFFWDTDAPKLTTWRAKWPTGVASSIEGLDL